MKSLKKMIKRLNLNSSFLKNWTISVKQLSSFKKGIKNNFLILEEMMLKNRFWRLVLIWNYKWTL